MKSFDITRLLLPPCCKCCGIRTQHHHLCSYCRPMPLSSDLERCTNCYHLLSANVQCLYCELNPSVIRNKTTLWNYRDNARELIRKTKYQERRNLIPYIEKELDKGKELFKYGYDLIVPIPPTTREFLKNGFSLPDEIARIIDKKATFNLLKNKGTRFKQSSLEYPLRAQNVKGIFSCKRDLSNLKILLVDDVHTTGATAESAALALLKQNAKIIDFTCLAMKLQE